MFKPFVICINKPFFLFRLRPIFCRFVNFCRDFDDSVSNIAKYLSTIRILRSLINDRAISGGRLVSLGRKDE